MGGSWPTVQAEEWQLARRFTITDDTIPDLIASERGKTFFGRHVRSHCVSPSLCPALTTSGLTEKLSRCCALPKLSQCTRSRARSGRLQRGLGGREIGMPLTLKCWATCFRPWDRQSLLPSRTALQSVSP
jgi:hypothetical protein